MPSTIPHCLRSARLLATLGLLAGPVSAQFPGDFFFSNPTPVVSEGEDVVLQVEVFTGSSSFGAAAVDVVFDVSEFEVLEVRPVGAGGGALEVSDIRTVDGHAVAAFFSKVAPAPFGSVTLFEIRGRARFAGGGTISLQVNPRTLLDPDGDEPLPTGGAGAVVTVVPLAPAPAFLAPEEVLLLPWWVVDIGSRPLRRPGALLFLPGELAWFGAAPVHGTVQTFDPAAPRDTVD